MALAIELFTEGSLNTFAKPTNVDTDARILCYDIRDLGKQLLPVGMLVVLDSVFNRIIRNRQMGRNTWVYIDEIYLLFQHEYSANFLFTLWKRVRKYGACCTGLTQNVDDLLQSHTARTMLANSEFLVMLNQAATDRAELARLLNISDIKTAERSSKKTVKTAQRTAKTAQQTVKTAQATAKATQRAVQTARATAKAAATTAKAAAKATVAAIKAAIAAMQELIAAIAAGGWVVLVVVLVICMIGLLIASPFGIFFADGGSPDAVSPTAAIVQINGEYADTLSALQAEGTYDRVEIQGRPPSWTDVFAVFAAKTAGATGGESVAVLDPDTVEKLRVVFWDMTKITTAEAEIEHPAEGDTPAWTETVLTITVTPRTPDDMRVFYLFTDQQNAALDELLTAANREMWNSLLYGSSGEIVAVALSQVGNVGGQPYWSWYGFNSRVEWCACFVSWCANECGYIDAGVIPKFAGCVGGSNWFKARGQWQDGSYEPRPGDLVFFDWDNKGSSGPQDDVPDHVGIVERVENGVVYTVEGNSGDSCRQRSYTLGHYEIWGYATPIY